MRSRKKMRSLEATAIFAGIGGLEFGLHRAGHRTTLFCECDPEATAVLAARFPGIPISFDVRRTDELVSKISPTSDLLTAGFPCTDLSQAGQTRGFAGGRSSLIRETIEVVRRRPFPNVLIENVPNWRHLHKGAYLDEVVSALERLGYSWAYRTIDARSFGLPQRRKRIFLFATLAGDPRDILFHGNQEEDVIALPLDRAAHGFYWTEGSRGLGWGEDCVPTLKGGSAIGIPAPPAIVLTDLTVVTPHICDCERLQGFPARWTDIETTLPEFGSGRFNARRRWQLIGNAVNVSVSSWIGERLAHPKPYDGEAGERLAGHESWPEAAYNLGRGRHKVSLSTWPEAHGGQPLSKFLRHPVKLLSFRATSGFLSRVRASRLRFVPGFVSAIERHLLRVEAEPRLPVHIQPNVTIAEAA
jgi:DNA (cytosine-5)-methyltransferase 1